MVVFTTNGLYLGLNDIDKWQFAYNGFVMHSTVTFTIPNTQERVSVWVS